MTFEYDNSQTILGASIKIIGVGGCGGNAVDNMIERGIVGVEFIACNTDAQALTSSLASHKIQIGKTSTSGLGAGAFPEKGKMAAEEDREELSEVIRGTDMLFITAGMGKGTGTGAAPVIASIAKNLGVLTIGIITKPFAYEGRVKSEIANAGIEELRKHVDTLIVVQNEKILSIANGDLSAREAYNIANDVLYRAAKGISEIITKRGHVNVDFADVKGIMADSGDAVMGSATASGESRAVKAAQEAISSPLLDGLSIKGSTGVLVNITGDVKMRDMAEAMSYIEEQAGTEAKIINGLVEDSVIPGEITVTVIATGFNKKKKVAATNGNGSQHSTVSQNGNLRVVKKDDLKVSPQVYEKMERITGEVFEKKEDMPAFKRMGIPTPEPLSEREEKPEKDDLPKSNQERIRKDNPDTPAFLRKIMD